MSRVTRAVHVHLELAKARIEYHGGCDEYHGG